MRRLSSTLTPFYRNVLPALWIVGIGGATVATWAGAFDSTAHASLSLKLRLLLVWPIGAAMILWFARRLTDVWLDGEALIVGGRARERIPVAAIEYVSETPLTNPRQIRLRIRPGAASREEVIFLAPSAIQLPFVAHPVTRELRTVIAAARQGPR